MIKNKKEYIIYYIRYVLLILDKFRKYQILI